MCKSVCFYIRLSRGIIVHRNSMGQCRLQEVSYKDTSLFVCLQYEYTCTLTKRDSSNIRSGLRVPNKPDLRIRRHAYNIGQLWNTRQSTFHVRFQLKRGSTRWTPFLSGFYCHPLNVHGHVRLMTYTLSSSGHTQWQSTEYHDMDDHNYHRNEDDDWNPWPIDEHWDNEMCFETTRLKSVVDS